MTFVIMLMLNDAGAAAVRSLREKMAADGVPVDVDDPPHISLASCAELDVDGALGDLALLASSTSALDLSFEAVGSFLSDEGTIYLAPVMTDALAGLQRRAMSIVDHYGANVNPYYAGGRWVPHCTLANRLTTSPKVKAIWICMNGLTAFPARTERVELIEFGPTGPAVVHGSFALGAKASVLGLHHAQITIPMGEEERGRAFYCGLLGLQEIAKPESLAGRGAFWLQVGDRQVHVGTEPEFDRSVTKAHLAYAVQGLDEWRSRLVDSGVEILDGVPIPGYDRFEFRDPFGNRVEMIEATGS